MDESIIMQAENLSKTFRTRTSPLFGERIEIPALKDVGLWLRQGDTLGLVGESGSGKSTVARLVLRLIEPSAGTIYYKGKRLSDIFRDKNEAKRFRREVQMVFQDPASTLNPRINIYNILKEPLYMHNLVTKANEQQRISELLKSVDLGDEAMYRYAHEFSGGQRQRIGIARAIATEPSLIILDEAVSSLDISIQSQILNMLTDLKKRFGLSYLFISHDLSVVKYICDTVVVLYLGRVMESGMRDDIFNDARHPYTELLLRSSFSLTERGTSVDLSDDIMLDYKRGRGCPFYGRCPQGSAVCKGEIPSVEVAPGHFVYCTKA